MSDAVPIVDLPFPNAHRITAPEVQLLLAVGSKRFIATGASTLRSVADRAGVVRNVLDHGADPTGATGSSAATQRAINSLPAAGGVLDLGPGTFLWDTPLTAANKSFALIGGTKGATEIVLSHAGVGIAVTQDTLAHQVMMGGFKVRSIAAAPVASFLDVTYAQPVPSYAQGTVRLDDIEIASNGAGTPAGSFARGVRLHGCWQPRIKDMVFVGQAASPPIPGTCAIELAECVDIWIEGVSAYWSEAVVRQSGYCEGIRLIHPSAVGAGWLLMQVPETIVTRFGYSLNGLWLTGGEINTQLGGLHMVQSLSHIISGNHWSRHGNSGAASWICYDYRDVRETVHTADLGGGGVETNTSAFIRLRRGEGPGGCALNRWIGPLIENVGTAVDFGVGTELNDALDVVSSIGTENNNVTDAGLRNTITFRTQAGAEARFGPRIFAGAAAQSLFSIADIPNAVNILTVIPGTTGTPAQLIADGSDDTVGLALRSKNGGGLVLGEDAVIEKIGFFGHTPITRPQRPTTLDEVVNALTNLGLTA